MELKLLEDFVSPASTNDFRRLDTRRGISQAAFSQRIHALEPWLGASLIDPIMTLNLSPLGPPRRRWLARRTTG